MSQGRTDGLFTLGVPPETYRLPHGRLGLPVILLVRRVILYAFRLVSQRGLFLGSVTEDEITAALRGVIENDLRQTAVVPGFNRRTYEAVSRQSQVENFDLSKLGKAPDLCFRLRDNEEEPRATLSTHDALFVECKRVDAVNPAGKAYCDDGLRRFVVGDYAWAMEEAMMLGYARAGKTIAKDLIPAMKKPRRLASLKTIELPRPIAVADGAAEESTEVLHVSRHQRGFSWVGSKGRATDIAIYHSWHKCD